MSKISGIVTVSAQDIFTSSTTQQHQLGAVAQTADGRRFKYSQVGSVATVPARMYQSASQVAAHRNLAPVLDVTNGSTLAVGSNKLTVTLGATAVTANQYAGGFIVITAGAGAGQTLLISSHSAAAASSSLVLTLEDPINTTLLVGTSKVDLVPNGNIGAVVTPNGITGAVIGVPLAVFPALSYAWFQVQGLAPVIAGGGAAILPGSVISNSVTVNGAVRTHAFVPGSPVYGFMATNTASTADGEIGLAKLNIE
jgi:hypothetical protein